MDVIIAEYLNYVDQNGKAIGHGKKVLAEALQLLDSSVHKIVCSEEYCPSGFNGKNIETLILPEICQAKVGKKLNGKILKNIFFSVKAAKDKAIWFTNTEWRLLAMLPFVSSKRKIIVTCYRDTVNDIEKSNAHLKKIKLFLVKQGLKRANLVLATNPNLKLSSNQIYVPDYIYSDFYKRFRGIQKKKQIVCVGAMRDSKDLRGVVEHFSETNIPVYIIGGFSDKEEYEWLKRHSSENIKIEDRRTPYDEYYKLIAESQYVIIPYKMTAYDLATSGILQETMFLDSIPIAPQKLLEYNKIEGIGYTNINDLPVEMKDFEKYIDKVAFNKRDYEEENIRSKIYKALEDM